jgi:hypothetical protein
MLFTQILLVPSLIGKSYLYLFHFLLQIFILFIQKKINQIVFLK